MRNQERRVGNGFFFSLSLSRGSGEIDLYGLITNHQDSLFSLPWLLGCSCSSFRQCSPGIITTRIEKLLPTSVVRQSEERKRRKKGPKELVDILSAGAGNYPRARGSPAGQLLLDLYVVGRTMDARPSVTPELGSVCARDSV